MKNSIKLIAFALILLFTTSCGEDTFINDNQENQQSETRSSGQFCSTCAAIDVDLKELSTNGNCKTSLLTIELKGTDCNPGTRQSVYLDDKLIAIFTTQILELEVEYCKEEDQILRVMGLNIDEEQWTDICFREVMSIVTTNQLGAGAVQNVQLTSSEG